jgi:glycine/D-amino acid oxidase-like deaminating enzyme
MCEHSGRVHRLNDPPATAELVVIGSGIVGAATAFYAARAGLSVVVVGASPLAYLVFSALVDPGSVGLLVGTGTGRVCLVVGLLLEDFAGHRPAAARSGLRRQGYLWLARPTHRRPPGAAGRAAASGAWTGSSCWTATRGAAAVPVVPADVLQARFRQTTG